MSNSKIHTPIACKSCGEPMVLLCIGTAQEGQGPDEALDLLLECQAACGSPALNAFVRVGDFMELD